MHELAAVKELINRGVMVCRENGIAKPRHVIVTLGAMTTYKALSVRYYFDLLKKDTILSNAELRINEAEGRLFCGSCNQESSIGQPYMIICPLCGSGDAEIRQGTEFILNKIEG
ncbi:MAG: hydrogenase maturation nickel metallochaperone HypA [archaeon]